MRAMALFILAIIGVSLAYTGGGGGSSCARISAPGTYALQNDITGAPYTTEYGSTACIIIDSDDVIFDCAGYGITGYGDSFAVYINNTASDSLDNITVRDCVISDYQFGIYGWSTYPNAMEGCRFSGNNITSQYVDLMLFNARDCMIDGNHFAVQTSLQSLNDSAIIGNTMEPAVFNCNGMFFGAQYYDGYMYNRNLTIRENAVTGCQGNGFDLEFVTDSFVGYNDAHMNWDDGFELSNVHNSTFYKNTARNNSQDSMYTAGFSVYDSQNDTFSMNTAENNSNGFDVDGYAHTLTDNWAYHNYLGMTLEPEAYENIVENNTIEENVYVDMIVAGDAQYLEFRRSGCNNTIRNNTGSGGRPIYFSNVPGTTLVGGTYSEVILCGADGSNLSGVTVSGSDELSNNGFMLVYAPSSSLENLVSEDNAVGLWLYGCDNCTITGGHASGNALGYLVLYSANVSASGIDSYGNNASLANLFGGNPMASFLSMFVNGGGLLEINYLPRYSASMMSSSEEEPPHAFYSGNRYSDLAVYDNAYGMAFISTGDVTVDRADIHDNPSWGIMDGAGVSEYPLALSTHDVSLYRNGRDIIPLLMGLGSPESESFESGPVAYVATPARIPVLPEGVLWGEYLQASMLFGSMMGSGETPSAWLMDSGTHGYGAPSVVLSADDAAESVYLTSETDLPARDSFSYVQGKYNNTIELEFIGPDSNKTPVNGEFFTIISLGEEPEFVCDSYCDGWGCIGEAGCYYYDEWGYCSMCDDTNSNGMCDNFECIDVDPADGECDNKCESDLDGNGICDFCDPILPEITGFAAAPGGSMEDYDLESLEMYYLNITDVYSPEVLLFASEGGETPIYNRTFIMEGQWLPVQGQAYEEGSVYVDSLKIPESEFLDGILGGSLDAGTFQGIYGLFATYIPSEDDDEPETPEEEPEQNETAPECASDSDCAVNEQCTGGSCSRFPCECGEAKNHECVEYGCCSDAQCASGESCQNHACKGEEPAYECASNTQCAATSFCKIPSGAAGGICEMVEILPCGEVRDHQFVAYGYECGTEPGCPSCASGEACEAHACIQADVSCPSTGIVGDKKTCEAKEEGVACLNCDYVVTAPNGQAFSGKTDENGNFELPLDMKGTYQVALLKDGVAVRIIQVQAFPQAQPEGEEKPAATGPDTSILIWVLALMALVVGGVLYWRSMGKNGGQKEKPKK